MKSRGVCGFAAVGLMSLTMIAARCAIAPKKGSAKG